ncbi:hypothetical protein F5884DRAFT_892682 [Xylogone sp. PMI_703]|nr:hypothetical protein F5884DRAFT_892682 [Xylogone sp. PMI_703]
MNSENEPKPWDFSAVFDLLHALSPSRDSLENEVKEESSIFTSRLPGDGDKKPIALGDFDRLWAHLGKSLDPSPSGSGNDSSVISSSPSDQSIFTFSAVDDTEPSDDSSNKTKEVRWKDDIDGTDTVKLQKSTTPSFEKHLKTTSPSSNRSSLKYSGDHSYASTSVSASQTSQGLPQLHLPNPFPIQSDSSLGLEVEIKSKNQTLRRQKLHSQELAGLISAQNTLLLNINSTYLSSILSNTYQLKSTAAEIPPLPAVNLRPSIIEPLERLTPTEKRARLIKKLRAVSDSFETISSSALYQSGSSFSFTHSRVDPDGVHVFVDCSNIVIGFYDSLRKARGIHPQAYIKNALLSWSSMALVLERGRPVARRVLVGSTSKDMKLPQYLAEAERLGYELNILERVLKQKNLTPRKGNSNGNGYATSGHSSGSEAPLSSTKVMSEQGVDEILHMKLLESIVDAEKPSTIVLASGDAAEAEYSGGFLKNVQRALLKGWKVEIIAWRDGLSQAYKLLELSRKWHDRFRIVELDGFSEDILAL